MECMKERTLGRLIGSSGGRYAILTEDGKRLTCPARGVLRSRGETPLVGDVVALGGSGNALSIAEILPRKNALLRPPMANLDVLLIVVASAMPEASFLQIDKLTTVAEFHHIEPVIVISKTDLVGEADHLAEVYRKAGFHVFRVGNEEDPEADLLRAYLRENCTDATVAVAGASGVGKSTLLNRLFPKLQLVTGEISRRIERGKQTTRSVVLYSLCELLADLNAKGFLADTPGFGTLDFVNFDFYTKEDLPHVFRELAPHLGGCRYSRCTHVCEEGCAILAAVEEGEIPKERHESYRALYAILKEKHPWDKPPRR